MNLHHIAYVCRDVEAKAESMVFFYGAKILGPAVADKHQGVKILFLELADKTRVELLEPIDETSPVNNFLARGGGWYHLCMEVDDLDQKLDELSRSGKAFVVKPPADAPAIDNRRVAFVMTDQKDIIEYIESQKK